MCMEGGGKGNTYIRGWRKGIHKQGGDERMSDKGGGEVCVLHIYGYSIPNIRVQLILDVTGLCTLGTHHYF